MFNLQLVEGEEVSSHAQSLELMKELGFHIIPFTGGLPPLTR